MKKLLVMLTGIALLVAAPAWAEHYWRMNINNHLLTDTQIIYTIPSDYYPDGSQRSTENTLFQCIDPATLPTPNFGLVIAANSTLRFPPNPKVGPPLIGIGSLSSSGFMQNVPYFKGPKYCLSVPSYLTAYLTDGAGGNMAQLVFTENKKAFKGYCDSSTLQVNNLYQSTAASLTSCSGNDQQDVTGYTIDINYADTYQMQMQATVANNTNQAMVLTSADGNDSTGYIPADSSDYLNNQTPVDQIATQQNSSWNYFVKKAGTAEIVGQTAYVTYGLASDPQDSYCQFQYSWGPSYTGCTATVNKVVNQSAHQTINCQVTDAGTAQPYDNNTNTQTCTVGFAMSLITKPVPPITVNIDASQLQGGTAALIGQPSPTGSSNYTPYPASTINGSGGYVYKSTSNQLAEIKYGYPDQSAYCDFKYNWNGSFANCQVTATPVTTSGAKYGINCSATTSTQGSGNNITGCTVNLKLTEGSLEPPNQLQVNIHNAIYDDLISVSHSSGNMPPNVNNGDGMKSSTNAIDGSADALFTYTYQLAHFNDARCLWTFGWSASQKQCVITTNKAVDSHGNTLVKGTANPYPNCAAVAQHRGNSCVIDLTVGLPGQ